MDEDLHSIDDLFKKAINGHEELPSGGVWEKIDKNLDKKKVVFISKKYNKLKWIAAALLMFSAGMAMYTLHTKMKNQELLQENTVNSKKKIDKNKFTKDKNNNINSEETLLNQFEKERITKDTAKINKFNNKNYQFSIDDNALASNEKKNKKDLRESRKAGSISPTSVEKHLKDFVENAEKYRGNKEKYERITGKQLVENKSYIEQKKTDNKLYPYNNKSLSSSKEQKNTLKNELEIHPERSDKEVALKTELQDHKLQIEPTNASLQNLLATLKGNNKITVQEQPNAVIKNNKPKTSKKSLFSATVFYSPDIVFSKVDNDHHTFREEDRNEIKNKEEIKKTYSTGVLINYNTGNKLSIQSGLTFSAMATDIKPKTIYARTDDRGNLNYRFNCSAGYSYVSLHSGIRPAAAGDSISASSSKNLLHYITVPLALKYNLTEGKFGLSTGLGAAINLLTKGKIETVIGNEKASINHIEGLSSMYLNSAISFGMNYEINQNIALSLTPAAKFALTSINKNAPVKTYLNSYGLAAGLTIKL